MLGKIERSRRKRTQNKIDGHDQRKYLNDLERVQVTIKNKLRW